MILVEGPQDIKVGDIVEFKVGNAHQEGSLRGEVTRVGTDTATLRSSGESRVVKFFRTKRSKDIRGGTYKDYLMRKLEPLDLWHDRHPSTRHMRPERAAKASFYTVDHKAIQDNVDVVIGELRALSAWLKEKP